MALTQIERTWLGLVSPPWHVRAAEAGWRLDEADAYCWRCGRTVGPFEVAPPESAQPGCTGCRDKRFPWDRFVRAGEYTGELRRAIQEVKFGRWRSLGESLGRELGRALARELAWSRTDPSAVLLVPVPAPALRRLRTGIDHTLVIARGIRSVIGARIARPIWRRSGPSQLQVPPGERAQNAARSFAGLRDSRIRKMFAEWRSRPVQPAGTVVVIDDVRTTGATMAAACRAVRSELERTTFAPGPRKRAPNGVRTPLRVWAAVVGVTPEPGRSALSGEVLDSLVEQLGPEG